MWLAKRRPSLVGLLQAAALLTVVFSLATFADQLHRYLELFSHFRLQYLLASSILALFLFALRSRAWASVMLILTAINTLPVAMWYLADTDQPDSNGIQLRLLHANVYSGNSNRQALHALIAAEQPDVIVLQEITDAWTTTIEMLRENYPYQYAIPRHDNFGIAVLAKTPFQSVDVIDSPPYGFPSLVVRQSVSGRIVTYVSTHPIPPLGTEGFHARNEQLASIAELMIPIAGPKLLIGDLNITMWAEHYRQLVESTGLTNTRDGFGIIPTWPIQLPFARIPIDHCLVSDDVAVLDMRSGPDIGSDHLPLLIVLGFL
ncbi:MAG: endonuclease/exonuclease/phosphatase family protein [Gammaproteobacteria bacterium]|nr:endonuclease/exonuclease/phosphatase family protein [Gammaproteobacteria bacterium]MDH3435079.1 endonuclease/exonuclease/phosphatase family protein [Gammaproteobacteria bacterium]